MIHMTRQDFHAQRALKIINPPPEDVDGSSQMLGGGPRQWPDNLAWRYHLHRPFL